MKIPTLMVLASLVCACILSVFALSACGASAQTPAATSRDTARAALLTIAEGVKVGDASCAAAALSLKNAKLATDCAHAYDTARAALVAADDGIDAWNDGTAGNVACAGKHALDALQNIEDALVLTGVAIPATVVDAIKLGETFAPMCSSADAGTKDVTHE